VLAAGLAFTRRLLLIEWLPIKSAEKGAAFNFYDTQVLPVA
jgi:hypothetical protein